MKRYAYAWLLVFFFLFSFCGKNQESKQKNPKDSVSVSADSLRISRKTEVDQNSGSPYWFRRFPKDTCYVYSAGTAISDSRSIAREKAILNARVALAQLFQTKKSGNTPDSLTINLQMSYVSKEKAVRQGKKWRYFVLLKMPNR